MKTDQRTVLIAQRTDLLKKVEAERAENRNYGIKHLRGASRRILDTVWNIDERIMEVTA